MQEPFARTVREFEELGSTSDEARRRVVEGDVELPLVVRARRQTSGRGRGTRLWWSDGGSLTATVAIDPAVYGLGPAQEARLALGTAVAIVEALEGVVGAGVLGIRWPNDVEARGRKLGGILPEAVDTPAGRRLLVGIGLNVATRLERAPEEVRRMATSVAELAGRSDVPDPWGAILARFAAMLPALAADDPTLAARWDQLDTLRGERVRVDLGPQIRSGVGRGIDAEGRLLLEVGGVVEALGGGQVLRERSGDGG